jgi:cytochrome c oxidase cbb3-type subunit 2
VCSSDLFQWGSKRTGPDLARLGGKYSDEWHRDHMAAPRSLVPESVMPGYPFLIEQRVHLADLPAHLEANRAVGVPYSDEMIANAVADARTQVDPEADELDAFLARYPKAQVRDFDGDPSRLTELDALIAYMQMLGTLVDFSTYEPGGDNRR